MTGRDDSDRYVEYLQRSILSEGWDGHFDHARFSEWVQKNSARLKAMVSNMYSVADPASTVAGLERAASDFVPKTQFEIGQASAIFQPLLEEIKAAAASIGLKPVRPIRLVTNTDVSDSPSSRPTAGGEHLLFLGPGTWSFCNYWAKAFTAVTMALARSSLERVQNTDALERALRADPSPLILGARLALYYGMLGTNAGFGEVIQPADFTAYRIELLRAMEMQIVGHEYAHFVCEEQDARFSGTLDESTQHELEFTCDRLSATLVRVCGARTNEWLMFTGAGAVVRLRAAQLAALGRDLCATWRGETAQTGGSRGTHPPVEDRIAALMRHLVDTASEDQREDVRSFLAEYDFVARQYQTLVVDVLRKALGQQ